MVVLSPDAHEFVKQLTGAGFTEQQAEAVTRAVVAARDLGLSHLATKDDLARLDARIDGLDARIDALEARMDAKIDALRAGLEADMEILKRDMTIRLGAMIAAAAALMTALDKLL